MNRTRTYKAYLSKKGHKNLALFFDMGCLLYPERSSVRPEHSVWGRGAAGSNPAVPTIIDLFDCGSLIRNRIDFWIF